MRPINELIWHCAATPEGREVSVDEIRRWHIDRGWRDIGYHKVVHLDGSVSEGRPESQIGAHVAGRNTNTLGYCYVGGVDANDVNKAVDTRTAAQKATMERLTREAIARHGLTMVSGHHDYAAKACPSFPARAEYAHLLKAGPQMVAAGGSSLSVAELRRLQTRLLELGYYEVGRADGSWGPKTRSGLLAFKSENGLPLDTSIDDDTWSMLGQAAPRQMGEDRAKATAKDLEGSRIVDKTRRLQELGAGGAAAIGGGKAAQETGLVDAAREVADQSWALQGLVSNLSDLAGFVADHWWVAAMVAAGLVIWWARSAQNARVEDHRTGKTA